MFQLKTQGVQGGEGPQIRKPGVAEVEKDTDRG